jgi:hypothetical protein
MPTKYRIKIYNILAMPRPGDSVGYPGFEDMFMRLTPGGSIVNLTSSGTATASSEYGGGYTALAALSGQSNWWHSAATNQAALDAGDVWWQYEFNADNVYIQEYTMRTRPDAPWWAYDTPKTWKLEWYSPFLSTWIVVDERTNISWTQGELKTFSIPFGQDVLLPYSGRITFNNNYIFRSTVSGVEVYNTVPIRLGFINSGFYYYDPFHGTYYGALTNVAWADEDYLYIGTNQSGILRSPMSSISGGVYNDLQTYKNFPDITSNNVLDIHGYDDYLCVITNSGIDEINTNTDVRYYTTVSGASRCFQTASGIYYLISGTLNTVYNLTSDWTIPDYSYNVLTHPSLFNVDVMNDLHVRDGVIYLATNNGIIIIKEERGSEASSDYKRFKEI